MQCPVPKCACLLRAWVRVWVPHVSRLSRPGATRDRPGRDRPRSRLGPVAAVLALRLRLGACARPPTLASLEIHVREKPHKQKRARSRFLSEASNPQTAPPKLKASSVHLRLTHTTLPTAHGPVGARRLDRRQRSTQQSTDECVRTTAHIYEGKALVAPACELRKAPSGVGQLPHPSQ